MKQCPLHLFVHAPFSEENLIQVVKVLANEIIGVLEKKWYSQQKAFLEVRYIWSTTCKIPPYTFSYTSFQFICFETKHILDEL